MDVSRLPLTLGLPRRGAGSWTQYKGEKALRTSAHLSVLRGCRRHVTSCLAGCCLDFPAGMGCTLERGAQSILFFLTLLLAGHLLTAARKVANPTPSLSCSRLGKPRSDWLGTASRCWFLTIKPNLTRPVSQENPTSLGSYLWRVPPGAISPAPPRVPLQSTRVATHKIAVTASGHTQLEQPGLGLKALT